MLLQLLIGTAVITITIITQVLFLGTAIVILRKLQPWLLSVSFIWGMISTLIAAVLWLVAGISISVWVWAGVFLLLDVFQTLESALYFSIVAFTTLGYGDVILGIEWRLLSGLTAANGLIVFGLNTAFLVELITRLRREQGGEQGSETSKER